MPEASPLPVTERTEKLAGLRSLTEHIAPGQWDYARRPNKKELANRPAGLRRGARPLKARMVRVWR